MISLELCEISLIFREIKTTTAKKFLPTCSKSQKILSLKQCSLTEFLTSKM